MKFLAILALILVATSATSIYDKYPLNFSSKRSIMTLLTQVESQLKTNGPLDAITGQLNQFRTDINVEQQNHDALFASQQEECASEFAFREQEVKAAAAALQEATETLDGCQSQKTRAEGDLALTKKQLQEARNLLAVAIDTRRREAYAFETATQTFTLTSQAVNEALEILDEIWSGEASFAQLNTHINGILKSTIKIRKSHLLGGVMTALAQLASQDVQADEALLNRVKTLLTNFRQKLENEFNAASAAEQAAIEAHAEEKSRLESAISQLEAQEQGLKTEIDTLNKCVVVQTAIVTSASLKQSRNQRIWDDAVALCEAVEEEYHTSTEQRQEELQLLSAIEERVEARFAEISEGVTERGMQDQSEWEHQNVTEYDDTGFVPSSQQ